MAQPAVVFGGPSPEHDISILTGLQGARALLDGGIDPVAFYWTKHGELFQVAADLEAAAFADGVPARAVRAHLEMGVGGGFVVEGRRGRRTPVPVSAVLNCCHGGPGEDGGLQSVLDLCGLRYTGPTAAGAALGMDKLAFAGVVSAAGLPTLPRELLGPETTGVAFDGPYIVKPRFGGSSIGIEVVDTLDTARALLASSPHLAGGAVVEPYLPDARDLEIAVRTRPGLTLSAIAEPLRTVDRGAVLSYGDKYLGDGAGAGMASTPRNLPAELPGAVEARVRDLATHLVEPARLRSPARVDFLWAGDDVWVNEVNTIPGALGLYLWIDPPRSAADLVGSLVQEAEADPPRAFALDGADGRALQAAGSIAAKLA